MNEESSEHYRKLMEHHLANANFYQGLLYHAWKCNKAQTKGLQHQARKIKRLQKMLACSAEIRCSTEAEVQRRQCARQSKALVGRET